MKPRAASRITSEPSISDAKAMELLNKVVSSNDFGLRKQFPWSSKSSKSDHLKTRISESEKTYLAEAIQCTFKKNAKLKIERLENPYLWGRYVLQYEEMKAELESEDVEVQERIMIHVTSSKNAKKIAETNYNWRLWRRARFGIGVCFATNAQYAHCHASEKGTYIVTGVLVANSNPGNWYHKIPKGENDTTTGFTENTCIKYTDNDFYPYYIVQALK